MSDNPKTPTKLDTLKATLAVAKQEAARAEKARDKADARLADTAEKFKHDRADADAKQADLDAATLAVTKATSALRAEQRNVA